MSLADKRHCPTRGGGELTFITAILERLPIEKILAHLGLDPAPPPKACRRTADIGGAG